MSILTSKLIPYRRASDGEIAGYLRPVAGNDLFEPVTLLGHALAAPAPRRDAEVAIEQRGMAALAEVWWVRAPAELGPGAPELRQPAADWTWQRFVVVELNHNTIRIRPQYAPPGGSSVTVSLPAADILHARMPDS